MTEQVPEQEEKKLKFPTAYTILFLLIIIVVVVVLA